MASYYAPPTWDPPTPLSPPTPVQAQNQHFSPPPPAPTKSGQAEKEAIPNPQSEKEPVTQTTYSCLEHRSAEPGLEVGHPPPHRGFFSRFHTYKAPSAFEKDESIRDDRVRGWWGCSGWIAGLAVLGVVVLALGLGVGLTRRHRRDESGFTSNPAPPTTPLNATAQSNLACPASNATTLIFTPSNSDTQKLVKPCGIDWPAGWAAASGDSSTSSNTTVRVRDTDNSTAGNSVEDIGDGTNTGRNGIVTRSFSACVDACAQYNAAEGYSGSSSSNDNTTNQDVTTASNGTAANGTTASSTGTTWQNAPCKGISYVSNMTWVDLGGVGSNRNCYLKTKRAEVVRG